MVTPQSDDNWSSSAIIPAGNAAMDSTHPDMLADLELSLIHGLQQMDRGWDMDEARKKRKSYHGRRKKRGIGDSGSEGEQGEKPPQKIPCLRTSASVIIHLDLTLVQMK